MEEQDRYGTEQLVQGKKEALTERVEQIKNEGVEPERDNERIAKLLVNNYRQALGPHTEPTDGRVEGATPGRPGLLTMSGNLLKGA